MLVAPATGPGNGRVAVVDREEDLQFLGREAIGGDLRDGAQIGRATPAARALAPLEIGGEFLEEVGPLGGILQDRGISRNRCPAHRPGVEPCLAPGGFGRLHDLGRQRLIGGERPLAPLPDLPRNPGGVHVAAVARDEQLRQLVVAQRIAGAGGHRRGGGEPLGRGIGPLLLLIAAVLREGPVEPTCGLRLLDEHVVEKRLHRKLLAEALELAANRPLVIAGGARMNPEPRLVGLERLRLDQLGEHLVADLLLLPAGAPAGGAEAFEERVGERTPRELREDALADRLVEGECEIAVLLGDAVPVPTRSAAEERRVDREKRGRRAVGLPLRHLVGDHLPLEIDRIERGRPIGDEPCERGLAERRLLLWVIADEFVGLAGRGQIGVEVVRLHGGHAAGEMAGERIGELGEVGRGRHVHVERLLELLLDRRDRRGGLLPFRGLVGLRLVVGRGLGRRLGVLELSAYLIGPLLEGGVRGRDHLAAGLLIPRHPVEAAERRDDGRLVGGIGARLGEDGIEVALSGRGLEDRDRRTDDRLWRPGKKRLVPVGVGGGGLARKRLPDRPDGVRGRVIGALERAVPRLLLREVPEAREQVGALRGGERVGRLRAVGLHTGEKRSLCGIDGRVGLVDEEGEPGRGRGLLEDLRKLLAQFDPLVGRSLVGLPALPVDGLWLFGIGNFGERRGPPAADRVAQRVPDFVVIGGADEDVHHVGERGGGGGRIDVRRGGGGDRLERFRERRRILAGRAGAKLEPGHDEAIPCRPRRALPHEADDLPGIGRGGEIVGRGPGEFAHQGVETVPAGDPLEFERQLLGHDGGETGRCLHRVAAGERLIEEPEVEFPGLGRLPQVGALTRHEGVGVVGVGEVVDEEGVEPGGGPGAGFVGWRGGEIELVARGGGPQVAGIGGILGGRQQRGGRRAGCAGKPGLDRDVGAVGAAEVAGHGHELHDLLLAGGGGVLRDRLRDRLELRHLRIGLRCHRIGCESWRGCESREAAGQSDARECESCREHVRLQFVFVVQPAAFSPAGFTFCSILGRIARARSAYGLAGYSKSSWLHLS